jgi:hypothetical protein
VSERGIVRSRPALDPESVSAGAAASSARRLAVVALALLAAGTASALASTPAPKLGVASLPQSAFRGKPVSVGFTVRPAGIRCALAVRYADGKLQPGLKPVQALEGLAVWRWTVPEGAALGPARLAASCPNVGRLQRPLTIVGSLVPPKITVEKSGFSVREKGTGGSSLSYGLVLANDSRTVDALDVNVLVNFVMADERLLGSASQRIPVIGAGAAYALGGQVSFPGAAPIARLEVVIRIDGRRPKELVVPAVANVRVVPSAFEPGWVGSVEGEIVNDRKTETLQRTALSLVVLDPAGNVVGGSSGFSAAELPPGTRVFFKVTSGLNAIPLDRAATALVSLLPTWKPTAAGAD